MSPSTAQPANADKQDVTKADTPKMDNESLLHALQILINQQNANTQALSQQSTANLQSSQTDLNLIDKVYRGAEYQANIASVLAAKDKTDAEKLKFFVHLPVRLICLMPNLVISMQLLMLLNKRAFLLLILKSLSMLLRQLLKRSYPSEIRQTIETQGDLAAYYRAQRNILSQRYGVDQSKIDAVADYLDMNGYSRAYLGFALDFCNDMSQHVGSDLSKQTIGTIFSWLSGDNWLRYLMSKNFIPKDPLDVYEENKEYLYDGKGNKTGEVRSSHRKEYQR